MKWIISLILIMLLASCTSQDHTDNMMADDMDDMMDQGMMADDMDDMMDQGMMADDMDNSKTVIIQGSKFIANSIEIKKGDTATWINKDSAPHTVTGETFDSGTLAKDESFTHTFTEAGTYQYGCTIHPFMKGEVIVS